MSEQNPNCQTANCRFSEESELEKLAERAAEKAIEKLTNHVYQEVGKSVISKFAYVVGVCSLGLYLWMKSKGVI